MASNISGNRVTASKWIKSPRPNPRPADPPATSTETTTASTNGISRSRSPSTTNTGLAPVSSSLATRPSGTPSG